jgi:hypothetical protein
MQMPSNTTQQTEQQSGKLYDSLKQTDLHVSFVESESLELDVMLSFVDERRSVEDTPGDMSICTENED